MKRYVIYSEEMGIFLGECLGLGFWSRMDPCGQDCATTLQTPADATQYMSTWKTQVKAKVIPIDCLDEWATMDECVNAGLPSWDPEYQLKD